ncbi:ribose 5-phosphate isomerase B [Deltaproteobacteria bacterium Smac51]|nr:ribose 5-phosphate isomerase B [Deltaproteobacteria bacterium Smac51]
MKLAIASDHGGRKLKKAIRLHLLEKGLSVRDFGVGDDVERADYPDYAQTVSEAVVAGQFDMAILVCGTGLGMAIAANKVKGIRAVTCTDEFMSRMARAHNNANILTLGERVLGPGLAIAIVDAFLETPFEGGRHQDRLNKIAGLGPDPTSG